MSRPDKSVPLLKEPKIRSRSSKKLLLLLFFLFVILFVVLFLRSSFSKFSVVEISGNRYVTVQQINAALRVTAGDSYFSVTEQGVRSRLKHIEAIQTVQAVKTFPGRLTIKISEYKTVAFKINPQSGAVIAILANSSTVPLQANGAMIDKPLLTGWDGKEKLLAKLNTVLATIPDVLLADISEIAPTPSVAYPDRIRIFTRSKFEVVTTSSFLAEKVEYLSAIIDAEKPGRIVMLDADYYKSY